jgi:hypothetical protein
MFSRAAPGEIGDVHEWHEGFKPKYTTKQPR